ncbi:hypothetical protein B296_00001333 [Ensete ventricosum]|uniref:Uncharacterized protein n=1 Tax=Ensete ventricosum TaxID=4639 RepID=A0A426ZAN1_ENSVE|nr:hypothetical protein B296_00001333 [Ensete ventricosum]
MGNRFCFDFRYTFDAPIEVSQQWYQSQVNSTGGGVVRPTPARPLAGMAGHGQAPCIGDQPQPGLWRRPPIRGLFDATRASPQRQQLVGVIAACGHNHLQHGTHRGGRLQGACKGRPLAASPTASRAAVPTIGVVAPWQGGCRRARAATPCVGATMT